jgi:hypothetical protein
MMMIVFNSFIMSSPQLAKVASSTGTRVTTNSQGRCFPAAKGQTRASMLLHGKKYPNLLKSTKNITHHVRPLGSVPPVCPMILLRSNPCRKIMHEHSRCAPGRSVPDQDETVHAQLLYNHPTQKQVLLHPQLIQLWPPS